MRVPSYRPATLEDVGAVPKGSDWIAKYMEPVHAQIKVLSQAMQSKVGLDNLNQEVKTVIVRDGEAVDLPLNKLEGKPLGAIILVSPSLVETYMATPLDVRKLRLTVNFASPVPEGDVEVSILAIGP